MRQEGAIMDDAGHEAAHRWQAAQKWAGLFGLSLLALTLSLWLMWRAAEEHNAALRKAFEAAQEIEVAQRQALETTQRQAEAWQEVAQREAAAQRSARIAAEGRRSTARAPEVTAAREALEAARREAELQEAAARREMAVWRETALKRVEARSPDPHKGQSDVVTGILAAITAFATLATGMATVLNLIIGWRAGRRQAQEFQFKIRQLNIRCRS